MNTLRHTKMVNKAKNMTILCIVLLIKQTFIYSIFLRYIWFYQSSISENAISKIIKLKYTIVFFKHHLTFTTKFKAGIHKIILTSWKHWSEKDTLSKCSMKHSYKTLLSITTVSQTKVQKCKVILFFLSS